MAYTLGIPINLGASQTGLTLKAQLFSAGVAVGGEVTTGFTEDGMGDYSWEGSIPDGFRGVVKFYAGSLPAGYKARAFINPQEAENTDVKTSTVGGSAPTAAAIADAVWDEPIAGHLTANTTGYLLEGAGMAGDPLLSEVPGSYPSGTAGAALGKIGVGRISVTSVVSPGGDTHLYVGDSYTAEHANALDYTDELGNWPDLTDLDVHFYVQDLDVEAEVVTPTGENKLIRVELTSAQTATLEAKKTQYSLKIVYPGVDPAPDEFVTITEGRAIIKESP
jgi:hypothetical protein